MKTNEEIEYSNLSLQFDKRQINRMVEELVQVGISVSWKETGKYFTLSIRAFDATQRLHFDKQGKYYRLRNRTYTIKDQRIANILQKFIREMKGHAVMKFVSNDLLVVQNIRYGEPVRIVQIKGPQKKVLFEKECSISIDEVFEAFKRRDAENRIPVLQLELDYELACLYEAIQTGDQDRANGCKEVLEKLHQEMIMLEIG